MFERVRLLVAERERGWTALRDQGWAIHRTEANFVWLRLGDATGITIRPCAGEGVRITVAETEANDRVIRVARELQEHSS